jgi:hypothetical protein
MKLRFAISALLTALLGIVSSSAQPTNAAWLNGDKVITGHLHANVIATNDATASDGQFLKRVGNRAIWDNPAGSGTVTSVGLSLPSGIFDVSGSPITGAGSFTVTAHTATGYLFNNAGTLSYSLNQMDTSTNAVNSTNFWGTLSGTNWSFASLSAASSTNFVIDCKGATYQKVIASGSMNFLYVTNGPGAVSIKIRPAGADRLITFPTNWVWMDTNSFTLSGSVFATTLTNTTTGSGPRIGWLSIVTDGVDPTNTVARYKESQ